VVVRNRLEQLRKRQRDEALQAQEELLAGVAKSASKKYGTDIPAVPTEAVQEEVVPVEEIEPYDRSMSPGLLDITRLPAEERQIDILTEEEDRRALVSTIFIKAINQILISNSIVRTTPCCCGLSIRTQSCSTDSGSAGSRSGQWG
jgi:hypothetical protein